MFRFLEKDLNLTLFTRFKANAGKRWIQSIDPYWRYLRQLMFINNNTNINDNNANVNKIKNNMDAYANNDGANSSNSHYCQELRKSTKGLHMIRRFKRMGVFTNVLALQKDRIK